MNIRSSSFLAAILLLASCKPDSTDDPIPFASFVDININLSLPEYNSLQQVRGYKLIDNKGIRGIIVYRSTATTYVAYERNCSFHPNEACATVNVDLSGLFLIDPCCNSTFDIAEGNPTGGPAWRPLRRYRTQLSGFTLTITDEIIN